MGFKRNEKKEGKKVEKKDRSFEGREEVKKK